MGDTKTESDIGIALPTVWTVGQVLLTVVFYYDFTS